MTEEQGNTQEMETLDMEAQEVDIQGTEGDQEKTTQPQIEGEPGDAKFKRFGLLHRIEHWVFMASFSVLGFTGLIQKFAASPISQALIETMGGVETVRIIHRISATVMMIVVIYHIGALGYRLYVTRKRMTMLPGVRDIRAAVNAVKYYFGFNKKAPQQGRYSFEEKAEYWAVVWGTVVMVLTGFMLWNPIATTRFLPGEFIPAAKAAHSAEALLAVLAIFLWHFYHVLVKTFNRSMFTGYLNEEQMRDEHPLELADIKAGLDQRPPDPKGEARRKRVFWPVYGVFAALMLAFVYWFVTFEETALAVHPPATTVEAYVPLTPTPLPTPRPTSTPAPVEAITWDDGIGGMFESKCSSCHNSSAGMGGLDLTSYQGVLGGGNSGPGIAPGDPGASRVLIVQGAGGHSGQFTPDEVDLIRQWVEAGAPEN